MLRRVSFSEMGLLKSISAISIFLSFSALAYISINILSPVISSNAETVTSSDGPASYRASISKNDSVSIEISPNPVSTIFTKTDTVSYTNTCPYGLNILMSTKTNSTSLVRTGNDDQLKNIPTILSGTSLLNNTWGYSIDAGASYHAVASISEPKIIHNTDSANASSETINVIYGVKADDTLPSGNYVNDIIYTVAVNSQCLSYSLGWDLNGGVGKSGTDYSTKNVTWGTKINLNDYTPTREGYTFTGWTNGSTSFTGDEANVDVNEGESLDVTMTAEWEEDCGNCCGEPLYLYNKGVYNTSYFTGLMAVDGATYRNNATSIYSRTGTTGRNGVFFNRAITIPSNYKELRVHVVSASAPSGGVWVGPVASTRTDVDVPFMAMDALSLSDAVITGSIENLAGRSQYITPGWFNSNADLTRNITIDEVYFACEK